MNDPWLTMPTGAGPWRLRLPVLAGVLLLVGCAGTPFDLEALESRHPALGAVAGHRLGDVTPYPLPHRGALHWFLCRWERGEALRVALPDGAGPRERELLAMALASWEAAGLGVRFEITADPGPADIAIGFGDAPAAGWAGLADTRCAVAIRDAGFAARLVRAEVTLQRTAHDWRGHEIPLREEELLGAALHELGHALGFQGHVRSGGIMVRNQDAVRRLGRQVLRGEPLRAPSVVALYRVPSGEELLRVPVGSARTAAVDRLAALAPDRGYRGPVVRLGDEAARIAWWDTQGRSAGVRIPAVRETLRDPGRLEILVDLVAASWLGPGDPLDLP